MPAPQLFPSWSAACSDSRQILLGVPRPLRNSRSTCRWPVPSVHSQMARNTPRRAALTATSHSRRGPANAVRSFQWAAPPPFAQRARRHHPKKAVMCFQLATASESTLLAPLPSIFIQKKKSPAYSCILYRNSVAGLYCGKRPSATVVTPPRRLVAKLRRRRRRCGDIVKGKVRDLEVLDADEDDADAQFELALNDVVSPR